MKWFQVDSDTPDDPKIVAVREQLGSAGLGALFSLWCGVANHGARPGWSVDSSGRPIPESSLIAMAHVDAPTFLQLVDICVATGHFDPRAWRRRRVIHIPAMARRADDYTRKRLRRESGHSPDKVTPMSGNKTTQHKTTQDKTTQHKTEKRQTARRAPDGDAALRERFETFWAAYPRKTAKSAAWRAWLKQAPSAELTTQILAALTWQKQQDGWLRERGRFIPHPATWIANCRWTDEASTVPTVSARTIGIARAGEEFMKS